MMSNLENKIEEYLDGLLSPEDHQAFEDGMQQDKVLADKVAIIKEINQTIATKNKFQDFQKTLSTLNNNHFQIDKKNATNKTTDAKQSAVIRPMKSNRRTWLMAASFLVLVVSSVLIWNVLKSETPDAAELFAANYEAFNVGQRGENDGLTAIEQQALTTYQAKDFATAIPLLEQLETTNPTDEQLTLQLGSAYLSTNQTKKAIATFNKIVPNSINFQAAQWYLALALLQNNELESAKETLAKLAKSGERTYPTKAKGLLEKL